MGSYKDLTDININPVKISDFEEAWKINETLILLNALMKKQYIILGGDILLNNLEYSYDNWYFEPDNNVDYINNVIMSYNKAKEYISKYITDNGNNYYVVVVVEKKH